MSKFNAKNFKKKTDQIHCVMLKGVRSTLEGLENPLPGPVSSLPLYR
jgi:hypothetical protein